MSRSETIEILALAEGTLDAAYNRIRQMDGPEAESALSLVALGLYSLACKRDDLANGPIADERRAARYGVFDELLSIHRGKVA